MTIIQPATQSATRPATPAITPAITPAELAARLGLPRPTPEQVAAVSGPLQPGVVVAGAGSGKTETMAARVVWLVANGLVRPEQVLGLTFTRKAARELSARVRRRLSQLAARGVTAGVVPGRSDPTFSTEPARTEPTRTEPTRTEPALGEPTMGEPTMGEPTMGEPTITTYDAFAGRVVAEHALRLGREPGTRLVTEAVAWQYAQRVVASYDGPMDDVAYAPATVVAKVLGLHAELAGHLVSADDVRTLTDALRERIESLPRAPGQRTSAALYADVARGLAVQDARVALLPLVAEFRQRKRADEVHDFADQAALAAELAEGFPEVGSAYRETYRVVLLDEYQDTSHAQLVLLRSLFGEGHPVTAVGDPCQSIYGWRGASTGTLAAFRSHFRTASGAPARLDSLTTSFRNGHHILRVANRLAQPLRDEGLDVPELSAHADISTGSVVTSLHLTAADEAADVARRARAFWDASAPGRSVAVLVRNRSQIPRLEAALRAVELPVEVVGVGGLLTTPEVADVVATLRVIADPSRGDALVRLLTGSRWRIGARDLDALMRWARRSAAGYGERDRRGAGDEADDPSIVDALDALPRPGWFSPEAHRRLSELSDELRGLRRRAGARLPDLVHDVQRTLGLDVEVAARHGATGRVNLERFLDVAAEFETSGESPSLSTFLAYLDAAETAERGLAPGEVEVSGDRVQVLTVHGAKGLEWDAVFVTGLVDRVFPAGGERDRAWLGDPAELPYPLRGDAAALPRFDPAGAGDQQEVREALDRFVVDAAEAARLEERRLGYVALTRARSMLVCSGYHWDDAVRSRELSPFLADIRAACAEGAGEIGVWVDDPGETNPLAVDEPVQWPFDPLGGRRPVLSAGAELVRAAQAARTAADTTEVDATIGPQIAAGGAEWDDEVDRLLAERDRMLHRETVEVELPDRLSVSQLITLRRGADALAAAVRRPVPRPPTPLARRGTAFHAWLEGRWGSPRLVDVDELPGAADPEGGPGFEITTLQEAFLSSSWAQRSPLDVEAPFEILVAGVLVRGRVDAVFATADGGVEVVDWKTGHPPRSRDDRGAQAVQLAAYRLAFAKLHDLPLGRVGAAFHYVRDDLTRRPADLLDEAELEALITTIPITSDLS